jgi:hypothetical protein
MTFQPEAEFCQAVEAVIDERLSRLETSKPIANRYTRPFGEHEGVDLGHEPAHGCTGTLVP